MGERINWVKKMKKYYYIGISTGLLILTSCTQKPAEIISKKNGIYNPNYSEVYVESPDGKMARSLRGHNNSDKAQEISIINKNSSSTSEYTVTSGDNLSYIAQKYGMKTTELAKLNGINKPYKINIGQTLKVIGGNNEKVKITKIEIYTVTSGDNLSSIAEKHHIKTDELAALNNLKSPYSLKIGQKLKISNNNYSSNNKKQDKIIEAKTYTVKSGDNLSSIARDNNTDFKELASLNNLKSPYSLRVGQKLKISEKVVVKQASKANEPRQEKNVAKAEDNNKKNAFMWPVKGSVISNFGNKANGLYNDGINISATKGSSFKSAEDGVVAYVGNELRGYGTIILIKHNNNWISAYAHCESVNVSRGDRVEKGQTIGTVGQSGNVETPQLYFSLRSGREAVDPLKYLN